MKKSKLKSLLREAFIAGGRYYIKEYIPMNIGQTEGFDSWYMNNVSERVDKTEPSESTKPKSLILDGDIVPKHSAKVLTKEEVEANRSSGYKYLDL